MSTYTVTDPTTNKSVDLEGDSPPTEQELNQIFATVHGGPSQPDQPGLMDTITNAVKQTPLGMAAQGANSVMNGIGKAFDATGIPVSNGVQQGAKAILQPARSLGMGVADQMTGSSPRDVTNKVRQTFANPNYQPNNIVDKAGSFLGENAAVAGATALSPGFGGPIAMMTQQAQGGKVSPLLALPMVGEGASRILNRTAAPERIIPPLLKSTKGIPTQVSRMALADTSILDLPGNSESIQQRAQGITDAVNEASRKVGSDFSNAYKAQGMESPVDQIKAGRPASPYAGRSIDQLAGNYRDAVSGDFFKVPDAVGAVTEMSPQEKLSNLTDLKRSLQDKAIYPPGGQQLAPSQGAQNAAIKQMAAKIDQIRGSVPGGDSLALADDAYHEMQTLKHTLISAFKDPATGQDYLNRILKGNTDWLTSGRNAAKVGAIQRVEQITGKSVLQPALREMAAAYLNNPETMSLPSFGLKSILFSQIPTKSFFKKGLPSPSPILGKANIASGLVSGLTSKSQDEGQYPAQDSNNNGNQNANQNNQNGNMQGSPDQFKHLDEATARQFFKLAGGVKALARKMATEAGYIIQ